MKWKDVLANHLGQNAIQMREEDLRRGLWRVLRRKLTRR